MGGNGLIVRLNFLQQLTRIRGSFPHQELIHDGTPFFQLLVVEFWWVEELALKPGRDPKHHAIAELAHNLQLIHQPREEDGAGGNGAAWPSA
jgi:hypothetical protein